MKLSPDNAWQMVGYSDNPKHANQYSFALRPLCDAVM